MREFLPALVALITVWCGTSWASGGTGPIYGPGGGGTMTCSAISSSGNALIGSDNSGLYAHDNGAVGLWKRYGSLQGFTTNNILSVAFAANPKYAVVGTDNGLFFCTHYATSADTVMYTWTDAGGVFTGKDVQAVCFGVGAIGDSNAVFAAVRVEPSGANNDSTIVVACDDITANPPVWTVLRCKGLPVQDSPVYLPVKIAEDPQGSPSDRDVYMLFGKDNNGGSVRELWRTTHLDDNSTSWTSLTVPAAPQTQYPIDMAVLPYVSGQPSRLLVSSANSTSDGTAGALWVLNLSSVTWTKGIIIRRESSTSTPDTSDTDVKYLTGAVWTDGTYEYVLSLQGDPGPVGSAPKCSGSPDAGGIWEKTIVNWSDPDTTRWRRIADDTSNYAGGGGYAWEIGWTNCARASGLLGSGVAKSLSRMKDVGAVSDGPYVGSQSFAWNTGAGFSCSRLNTDQDTGSKLYGTTRLDNANPVMLAKDPADSVWVGYYDVGLWKYNPTGNEFANHNDTDWDWDGYGGNVTGMVWTSSTNVLVIAAPSSKGRPRSTEGSSQGGYDYRLYGSTSSGDFNTWSTSGVGASLPYKGDGTNKAVWLNSLWKDPATSTLYVAAHRLQTSDDTWYQEVYGSTNNGANWSKVTTGHDTYGFVVVRAWGDTIYAGGFGNSQSDPLYVKPAGGSFSASGIGAMPQIGTSSGDTANVRGSIHRHLWDGVQDIHRASNGKLYVTVFARTSSGYNGPAGVYKSDDGVTSFAQFMPSDRRRLRRSVFADSSGLRIQVASGRGFSGVVHHTSSNPDFGAPGIETLRGGLSGTWVNTLDVAGTGGYLQANAMVRDDDEYYYFISPGYGMGRYHNSHAGGGGGCHEPCEMEGPNPGGGGDAAHLTREEGAPKLPRTMFSIADARALISAGKLELYDVSGRKARTPSSGVYFVIERNETGVVTARRAVLVMP